MQQDSKYVKQQPDYMH